MLRPSDAFGFRTCATTVVCDHFKSAAEECLREFASKYSREFVVYSDEGSQPRLCAGTLYSIPNVIEVDTDSRISLATAAPLTPDARAAIVSFIGANSELINGFESSLSGRLKDDPVDMPPEEWVNLGVTKRSCRELHRATDPQQRSWGVVIGLSAGGRQGRYSNARCSEIMNQFICAIGCDGAFSCQMKGNDFAMKSSEGWVVDKWRYDLNRGVNPYGVRLFGFKDFNDVWPRYERAVSQLLVQPFWSSGMTMRFSPSKYRSVYSALNAVLTPWDVKVENCLPFPPIGDAIAARLEIHRAAGRLPFFHWHEFCRDKEYGEVFQMDAVIEPDGCALELHGNCTDMKTLLARANVVPGLEFEPKT